MGKLGPRNFKEKIKLDNPLQLSTRGYHARAVNYLQRVKNGSLYWSNVLKKIEYQLFIDTLSINLFYI